MKDTVAAIMAAAPKPDSKWDQLERDGWQECQWCGRLYLEPHPERECPALDGGAGYRDDPAGDPGPYASQRYRRQWAAAQRQAERDTA